MQSTGSGVRHLREPRAIHFPSDAQVPETKEHLKLRTALYLVIRRELGARACIGSDQFVYWNAKDPRVCLAPDVFVKLGARDVDFPSWKTWERGTPELAVEILSENEDWAEKLDRYHELGIRELVQYDPSTHRMRIWDRVDDDLVERETDGTSSPCLTLGLSWFVAPLEGEPALRIAREGKPIPTDAERVAELEAELAKSHR